jgi:hypothetical protein
MGNTRAAVAEIARRYREQAAVSERRAVSAGYRDKMLDALHPKQRAFVLDPSARKCAVAGRRAGKTEGFAVWLLDGWERYPNELSLFIARTAGHARRILWPALHRVNSRYELGIRFRETPDLKAEMPNGYGVWLTGSKDFADVEKLRGPRYRRAAIDESGSFSTTLLRYLVEDILDPALLDLNGELALGGSPGVVPAGFFYQRSTGDGGVKWSTHDNWTCLDNPFVAGAEYLEKRKADNGWDDQHPTYRREYLGLWVKDLEALVFPYDGERNAFDELPYGAWTYTLGVDLGYSDASSFVVVASRDGHPEVYVLESEQKSGLIPSAVAARVDALRHRYTFARIVVDSGGAGIGYASEMRERYGIPAEPADKRNKRIHLEMLRGDLKSGTLRIQPHRNRELIDEMQRITWNEERDDLDDRFDDHLSHGLLYAWRAARPWYDPQYLKPPPDEMELKIREIQKKRGRKWWQA